MKWLIFSLLLTSCITPDQWKPEQHQAMMMRCRIMCGKNRTASYDAWGAECTCIDKK